MAAEGEKRGLQLHAVKNKLGLTPLCVAAYYNKEAMFAFLLELRRIRQWSYGPVTSSIIPLEEFDWVRVVWWGGLAQDRP